VNARKVSAGVSGGFPRCEVCGQRILSVRHTGRPPKYHKRKSCQRIAAARRAVIRAERLGTD